MDKVSLCLKERLIPVSFKKLDCPEFFLFKKHIYFVIMYAKLSLRIQLREKYVNNTVDFCEYSLLWKYNSSANSQRFFFLFNPDSVSVFEWVCSGG